MSFEPVTMRYLVDVLEGSMPNANAQAFKLARSRFGSVVTPCSILNAKSGSCSQNCVFCAQSAHNSSNAAIYPLMEPDKVLDAAIRAREDGAVRFSIVTSGYSVTRSELNLICNTIALVKEQTGLYICASLGVLNIESLKELKSAGLNRYHHNIESAESFYPNVCTSRTWQENADTIKASKEAKLDTCCGGIFGLGESVEQRAEMLIQLREIAPDGVPINFIEPIQGTPLESTHRIQPDEALRIISATRIACPNGEIILCGGRVNTLRSKQIRAFDYGANGLMIGDYLTVKGNDAKTDLAMVKLIGYAMSSGDFSK